MGQIPHRTYILSITNAYPCEITTTEDHGYSTYSFVRLTNLNGAMPAPAHGSDQLNNNRYRIIVTGLTTFTLQNPITFEAIDSTNFPPYSEGGFCNLIEKDFIYYNDEDNNG